MNSKVIKAGSGPIILDMSCEFRIRASVCSKLVSNEFFGSSEGLFAFADSLAYFERIGGVASASENLCDTSLHAAVSTSKSFIQVGFASSVVVTWSEFSWGTKCLKLETWDFRYLRNPPKATTSAAPPPKQTTRIGELRPIIGVVG